MIRLLVAIAALFVFAAGSASAANFPPNEHMRHRARHVSPQGDFYRGQPGFVGGGFIGGIYQHRGMCDSFLWGVWKPCLGMVPAFTFSLLPSMPDFGGGYDEGPIALK
jgi:hypothetical protein